MFEDLVYLPIWKHTCFKGFFDVWHTIIVEVYAWHERGDKFGVLMRFGEDWLQLKKVAFWIIPNQIPHKSQPKIPIPIPSAVIRLPTISAVITSAALSNQWSPKTLKNAVLIQEWVLFTLWKNLLRFLAAGTIIERLISECVSYHSQYGMLKCGLAVNTIPLKSFKSTLPAIIRKLQQDINLTNGQVAPVEL